MAPYKLELDVRDIQTLLNGFVCMFKPRDMSISTLEKYMQNSICEQANCLERNAGRPPPMVNMPIVEAHPRTGALLVVGTRTQTDYSKHSNIVGPMFRPESLRIEALNYMEPNSSGVCLFGLNDGCDELEEIRDQAWISEYFVDGLLGTERVKHMITGKVNFRAEYGHVSKHMLNRVMSMVRTQFKRVALQCANVDPQSQEAFELARQGAPRPKVLGTPLVYGIDLVQFRPPLFRLQIQVTGETDKFLRELVHEIGCMMNSTASPRRLRRVRQGCFGLEHALLDKHVHLENVLKNMMMCGRMIKQNRERRLALSSSSSCSTDVVQVKTQEELDLELSMVDRFRLRNDELEQLPEPEECLRLQWAREY